MEILKTYYLYCLIDPNLKIPKYIGISSNPDRRFKDHLKDKSVTSKTLWINSLKEGGLVPILKVIRETNSVEQIKDWEIKAIKKYKDIYKLTNSTEGGELDCEGTPINEFDINGNYIDSYNSMTEYCNLHGWPETWSTSISAVCLRKRNYAHERIFRYINDSVTEADLKKLNEELHRRDPKHFIIVSVEGELLGEFNSFQEAMKQGFGNSSSLSYSLKGTKGYGSVKGNLVCYDMNDYQEKLKKYWIAKAKGRETKISKYDLEGNYIDTYFSEKSAAESINRKSANGIRSCLSGKQAQCGGYQWKYGDSKENIGLYKKASNRGKAVSQYTLDGKFIKKWPSARNAAVELNIDAVGIRKCAEGTYNKSGGYKWKYN